MQKSKDISLDCKKKSNKYNKVNNWLEHVNEFFHRRVKLDNGWRPLSFKVDVVKLKEADQEEDLNASEIQML